MIAGRTIATVAVALSVAVASSCARAGDDDSDTLATRDSAYGIADSPAAARAPSPGGTLSDAQVAHVLMTANSIDSSAGVLAADKGNSQAVRDFGSMMVRDHGDANRNLSGLTTRLAIGHDESDLSRRITSNAQETSTRLAGLTGGEFDRAYMDAAVKMHQSLLDNIDQQLLPGIQNAELKAFVDRARTSVSRHLTRARELQTTIVTQ
jgi:putative membrane protein